MITMTDLIKTYGYASQRALDKVNLTLPRGEIVGLFGENGAGKTTLMKCILGLLDYKGEITLDGKKMDKSAIHSLAFATCEHSFFPQLTGQQHREFYETYFPKFRKKRYEALMEFFSLPQNKPIASFSTGQKNQFEVIMALSQGADYIIMDEPFAGNDVFNRGDFYKVLLGILEPNETILLSTHLIEEVELFIGRAILLGKGKILGDVTMEDLENQGMSLMDYVKSTYGYQSDRVGKALEQLTTDE